MTVDGIVYTLTYNATANQWAMVSPSTLSPGVIAGIVLGVVFGVAIIVVIIAVVANSKGASANPSYGRFRNP